MRVLPPTAWRAAPKSSKTGVPSSRIKIFAGLTVLALVYFSPDLIAMGDKIDFEMILPYTIRNFIPVGLMGILIAGLLSAFMSTFAATVNAAPAYIVNDIYKRYINPHASDRRYVILSYIASFLVVAVGIGFGFIVESINQVTLWIVLALWGGYAAANLLKWYWWRFNAHGYFWGMVSGIAAALAVPKMLPGFSELESFPVILLLSVIGCIAASLLTKPDPEQVLIEFYRRVRPWGFWKPIYEKVVAVQPDFKANTSFKRDMFNIFIGIIWQTALVVVPIYLVIQQFVYLAIGIAVIIITSIILKKSWYDRLES